HLFILLPSCFDTAVAVIDIAIIRHNSSYKRNTV
ncbi:MAG: hypothetical protein ACI96P_001513, partial [Candidatus Azotimanducaceae bacterium]